MTAWPGSLPTRFERAGFHDEELDTTLSTQMDVGPPKERLRNTVAVVPFGGAMVMTTTQLNALRTFYKTDVAQRTMAFDFPDPYADSGTISVKFAAAPSWRYRSPGRWLVQIELNRQPT